MGRWLPHTKYCQSSYMFCVCCASLSAAALVFVRLRSRVHLLAALSPCQTCMLIVPRPCAMAGKSANSRNGPLAKRAAAKAKAADECQTALDATGGAKRRRQLGRRDTEKQVERCLKSDHFKHISASSLSSRVVDGRTLRETLAEAHRELPTRGRLGANFLATLGRKFSECESCIEALKPSVENLPVCTELVEVLSVMASDRGSAKSLKVLQSHLERCTEMNERNLIGMVKAVMSPRQASRQGHGNMALSVMMYMEKCPLSARAPGDRGSHFLPRSSSHTRASAGFRWGLR